jgi:microcystin-dependent protein
MEPFIVQIVLFAGNFAPRGWALCNGQLLSIAENSTLFSVIGTFYGGNGVTTFALPDLRSRVPLGTGQGPGLSHITEGEMGGWESVTLLTSNLPAHTHVVRASSKFSGGDHPGGRYLGASPSGNGTYDDTADSSMAGDMIAPTGNNIPFEIRPPYLGMNYIIAMEGVYPSRG